MLSATIALTSALGIVAVRQLTANRKLAQLESTAKSAGPSVAPSPLPPPVLTKNQFTQTRVAVQQKTGVDIGPYESCITNSAYTAKLLDATMIVCITDPEARMAYVHASLAASDSLTAATPTFLDCYAAAISNETFAGLLTHPVGVSTEADDWAVDKMVTAGTACPK